MGILTINGQSTRYSIASESKAVISDAGNAVVVIYLLNSSSGLWPGCGFIQCDGNFDNKRPKYSLFDCLRI